MSTEDELDVRSERREALYGCDIFIEIGFRPKEPDGRGIICIAGEEQAVGAIDQRNGIRSVARSGKNFDGATAEIDFVVVVKESERSSTVAWT